MIQKTKTKTVSKVTQATQGKTDTTRIGNTEPETKNHDRI